MHRLTHLDRRSKVLALVVVLALAAPFAASVVRALDADWRPSNDDALIALRVHDVLAGDFPEIGQPSTADQYAGTDPPHHPGPIEFYLLAPFVGVFGSAVGMLLGAGTINLAAVLVAVWVVLRRAGPGVALGAAVVFGGLAWAQGPALLTDPVSSNMGGIPLLALAVVAWAVVDGDLPLLPLAAFWASFVFQQHLAIVGLAAGTAAWAGLGAAVAVAAWSRHVRARRVVHVIDPLAARSAPSPPWPWILGAAAVTFVAWLPVLADQFFGTGNLSRIVRFAGSSDRPTLGLRSGLTQAARALAAPPLLLRTNLDGNDVRASLAPPAVVACALVVAALLAVVVVGFRGPAAHRNRARARLALTALVVAALGAVTGSNVPDSVEASRLNFYRWTFVVSALTWLAIGWAVAAAVSVQRSEASRGALVRPRRGVPVPAALGVTAVAVVAALAVGAGHPRDRRDQPVFATEDRITAAAIGAVEGSERVLLVPVGASAGQALAPALALELVEAGHAVRVPPDWQPGYGEHFVAQGGYEAGLVLVSGRGSVPPGPGRVVAHIDLNAATAPQRTALAAALRGKPLVRSADADRILTEVVGSATSDRAVVFALLLRSLSTEPDEVLRYPLVAEALRAGYLSSPTVDRALLDHLVAHPPVQSWNDDVIEVRVLTPAEIAAHRTELGLR